MAVIVSAGLGGFATGSSRRQPLPAQEREIAVLAQQEPLALDYDVRLPVPDLALLPGARLRTRFNAIVTAARAHGR